MPLTVPCPGCNASLNVREEYAGKKVRCPRCHGEVVVPAAAPPLEDVPEVAPARPREVEHVEEVRPAPRGAPRAVEPETAIGEGAPERRPLPREVSEGDDRRPRRRAPDYKPCPRCGSGGATRVTWTPWGSFYGPAMLTHVRCPKCGYAYNGRTGRSNTVAAVFFVLVPLILILGIIFGLLLALRIIRL
jgi:predicted RNA-binding Zn-ribbon protein involved in translation (DUF1610 family)